MFVGFYRWFHFFNNSVLISTQWCLLISYSLLFLDGFAFSQEEGGAVSQSDMIRVYNTCSPRPEGV